MNRVWKGSSSAAAAGYFTRALMIVSYFVLLLLAATISAQARAATTGSEKFIPAFLIYYGGGPALVADDAPKLAKFDLINIDRFRYDSIGSNTWAAIKALNPNVQIYLYQMGPEAPSYMDSTAPRDLNGLGRYNVSRGHFMGSLNGDHPELYLLSSSDQRIYNTASSNVGANQYWHLMDFGSAAYQSYWLTAVNADIVDQPWVADGVFADNCFTRASSGSYSATAALYPTSSAWSAAMNSFANAITAGLHAYGQKLWCNRGGTDSSSGAAPWLTLDGTASPPDVLLEANAFAVDGGSSVVRFHSESAWKRQIDNLRAIRNSKVAVVSHTRLLEDQTGTDNNGRPVTYWQTLWYALGSFLLAKDDVLGNAYFMFRGGSGYNKIWWHDEYDNIDLGKALGPYAVSRIGSVNIYWREFEKGYVYVNPTSNSVGSVNLPREARQLTRDNMTSAPDSIPSVSAFALNGHSAAILLKVETPAPPDTIAPTVPGGLTGTASPTQIDLSWNAATDNVGVAGYLIHSNDVSIGGTTTTSFSHIGLAAGTTYNYSVSAYDAVPNHSARSAAVAVTTPLPPDTAAPSVPTGLTSTAVSPTEVNLSWNASTDNVGVVGYRVYRDGALVASPNGTSASITGLSASTPYAFTVAAVDAAGNASAQSAPLSVTTAAPPDTTAPSVPAGLTASAITLTSLTLSWNASTDNVSVVGYRVYRDGALVASPTGTSASITGLSASTLYAFSVAAVDAAGNASAPSAPLAVTTLAPPDTAAPSTPTGLTASAVTLSSLTLSWNAATDNIGVTGYRVHRDGTLVASPAGTSLSLTGLAAITQYAFTVAAVDAAGNVSAPSAPLSVTTPAPPDITAPSSPTGLTASAITPTSLTLSWDAATDNVGVTGYRVYNGALVASPAGTSLSLTGLSAGTLYTFTVVAIDAAGNASAQSAPVSVTTPAPFTAHFKFDEAGGSFAADASGNNNTATLSSGASFAAGSLGNALTLDGVDGYARVSTTTGLNLSTALTIAAWIKPSDLSGAFMTILIKGEPSLRGYGLNVKSGALNFVKVGAADITSGVTLSIGVWQHVAVTWNAATSEVKFYKNGALAQTLPNSVAVIAPLDVDALSIGSWPTGGAYFNGAMDDLRVHSSDLSAAEIKALFDLAPSGDTTACANPAGGYEGFGRNTTGGAGQPVYRVTNLNDSGPGSLRDAVSQGNRCVVFGVGGTIALASMLAVRGANITIDGFTAPSPGITLRNYELEINGLRGASNVVVRGIRSRDAFLPTGANPADGISILATHDVVIDHVSVIGFGDGAIDISDGTRDVTIQWSIFAEGNPTVSHNFLSLVSYNTTRISFHHNLFINGASRSPHCSPGGIATSSLPEVICDVRNNLIWNHPYWGTEVRYFGTANVVNNYYYSSTNSPNALFVDTGGLVYASGNFSQNGLNVDSRGNRPTPFTAIVPNTTDAITAAHQIVAQAGARGPSFGLDSIDQNKISQVPLVPPPPP